MRQAKTFKLKIVSGGQTGVDRAALDAALALNLPHGGWCPRGRRAEDGPIPVVYQLRETASPAYYVRTEQNVRDSDATLIIIRGPLRGGTALTWRVAQSLSRPWLIVDLRSPPPLADVRAWLAAQQVQTLNVAGPRESQSPGIAVTAREFLVTLFRARRPRPRKRS